MNYLKRKRTTAGNICLVVFVAFLSLIIFGSVGPISQASAAVVPATGSQITGTAKAVGNGLAEVTFNFRLDPTTDPDYSNYVLKIWDQTVNLSNAVYSVSNAIYQVVYNFVYPQGWTDGLPVYGYVYLGDVVYQTVYLNPATPPPSGGGGGGGGGSSTAPVTTTTDSGKSVYNPSTGVETIGVDTSKVAQLLNQEEVVIEAVHADAKEVRVDLPVAVLNLVDEAAKDLVIMTADVTLTIPPTVLQVPEIQALVEELGAENVTVSINVKEAAASVAEQVAQLANRSENRDLTQVGKIFEFTLTVSAEGKETTTINNFNGKVTVAISYDPTDVATGKVDKLGAYKVTVNGFEYRTSQVDKANNLVYFETPGFSAYTLMVYDKTFADLVGHWAKADVELMASKHLAFGMSENEFAPDVEITRAQFATMLQRILELPLETPANPRFSDVPKSAWYYSSVEAAAKAGLVVGNGDGTFSPEAKITRQEMAAMVVNAMKLSGKSVSLTNAQVSAELAKFNDAADIKDWAKQAAAIAAKEGLIQGMAAGVYAPNSNATRAQGIVILKRFMDNFGWL